MLLNNHVGNTLRVHLRTRLSGYASATSLPDPHLSLPSGPIADDAESPGGSNTGGAGDTYEWSWGDGTTSSGSGEGASETHTYANTGTYTVRYTLTNSAGSAYVEGSITILPKKWVYRAWAFRARSFASEAIAG